MIIFIFGEDDFRGRQKIKQIKEKFLTEVDPSGNSLNTLNGPETSIKEIHQQCGASSLLASKRMIIIKNLFNNPSILEEATDYFKSQTETGFDNILVFWEPRIKTKKKSGAKTALIIDDSGREKPLTKKAQKLFDFLHNKQYVQEFSKLSNTDMAKWIQEEVESQSGKISHQASQLLIGLTGGDLWQLYWEIKKLLHYKQGQDSFQEIKEEKIELKDVETLVSGMFDESIFALTDAISSKNKALAIKLLEDQLSLGVNEQYLLVMITRQIKILLQIRQALDMGHSSRQITSQLKLHPFIIQKGINQARYFSLIKLKTTLNKLIEIDNKLKIGQGEARSMLDLFLWQLTLET